MFGKKKGENKEQKVKLEKVDWLLNHSNLHCYGWIETGGYFDRAIFCYVDLALAAEMSVYNIYNIG